MTNSNNIITVSLFSFMLLQMLFFFLIIKKSKLSIGGTPPIKPFLFKTVKASMFLCWLAIIIQSVKICNLSIFHNNNTITIIAHMLFAIGVIFQFVSYINLGKNLKFGIPANHDKQKATLQTKGIYKLSRNPMYLGFYLITLASCFYVLNPIVWLLASYTIIWHHIIVLKEEEFLQDTFGYKWTNYKKTVRRYI